MQDEVLGAYAVSTVVCAVIATLIAQAKQHPAWLGLLLGGLFNLLGVAVVLVIARGDRVHALAPPHPHSQWLPDPTGRHQHRLWDGQRWSAHVSDSGRAGFDPLE